MNTTQITTADLTANEAAILKHFPNFMFVQDNGPIEQIVETGFGRDVWTWSFVDDAAAAAGISVPAVKGVISSMVKKGLLVANNEGPADDHTIYVTDAGLALVVELQDKDETPAFTNIAELTAMPWEQFSKLLDNLQPKVEVEAVKTTIAAHEISITDILPKGTVAKVANGTKRTTAWNADGKEIGYFFLDDSVEVTRVRPTDESTEAIRAAKKRQDVLMSARAAQEAFNFARTKLNDLLDKGRIDNWTMTNLAEAEADLYIWTGVVDRIVNGSDPIDAAQRIADSFVRDFMGYRLRGESRSTSQMNNLLEDIANAKRAAFARKWTSVGLISEW